MKRIAITLAVAVTVVLSVSDSPAQRGGYGILNREAPPWEVTKWLNVPEGKTPDVTDYRGKVLYLYCFQSWCPGCHRHGFPTLKAVMKHYEGRDDVAFVAVQTVFEGYGSNTFEDAKRVGAQYDLDIPIGHSGEYGVPSEIMARYRNGGTPWTVLIDQKGVVRFNDFHIQPEEAVKLMDSLVAHPPGSDPTG